MVLVARKTPKHAPSPALPGFWREVPSTWSLIQSSGTVDHLIRTSLQGRISIFELVCRACEISLLQYRIKSQGLLGSKLGSLKLLVFLQRHNHHKAVANKVDHVMVGQAQFIMNQVRSWGAKKDLWYLTGRSCFQICVANVQSRRICSAVSSVAPHPLHEGSLEDCISFCLNSSWFYHVREAIKRRESVVGL